jgi:hypothetical protein
MNRLTSVFTPRKVSKKTQRERGRIPATAFMSELPQLTKNSEIWVFRTGITWQMFSASMVDDPAAVLVRGAAVLTRL